MNQQVFKLPQPIIITEPQQDSKKSQNHNNSFIPSKIQKKNNQKMLMLPFNRLEQPQQKVDICFHNCMLKLRSNLRCLMLFYLVRLLVVGYEMVKHLRAGIVANDDDGRVYGMMTVFYCILVVSNIATLTYARWLYVKYITNTNHLYYIAQLINHSRLAQQPSTQLQSSSSNPHPTQQSPTFPHLTLSPTVYQFQNNILLSDIDHEYRLRAERNCTLLINQQLDSHEPVKCWGQFFNLCSVAVFVYAVVLLAQGKGYTNEEMGFVVGYLVIEILTRFFIYLVLVIVGLMPFLCIGVCVYSCFCKKKTTIELPQVKQATMDTVKECQGNCPICYQDVQLNQKVITLACSTKHVFHQLCIKGWTQLGKDTCPVCRALI